MGIITRAALRAAVVVVVFAACRPAGAASLSYIALGDSLAFGVGLDTSPNDVSNGDRGYVRPYADALAFQDHGDRPNVVNLGISGETSDSFFNGGGGIVGPSSPGRNVNYQGLSPVPTQYDRFLSAVAAEHAAGRDIGTVSVSLGSNDLFALQGTPAFQTADPATQQAMLGTALGQFAANYAKLLTGIRSTLPDATLLLLGTYNPYGTATPEGMMADAAIRGLNGVISAEAASFGGHYVDIYTPISGHELTDTYIATGNAHPTLAGYQAIALQMQSVPEPATALIVGLGAALWVGVGRRRRR